jgi:hypothetical protein
VCDLGRLEQVRRVWALFPEVAASECAGPGCIQDADGTGG